MFVQNYKLMIMALCEPRISGIKADNIFVSVAIIDPTELRRLVSQGEFGYYGK